MRTKVRKTFLISLLFSLLFFIVISFIKFPVKNTVFLEEEINSQSSLFVEDKEVTNYSEVTTGNCTSQSIQVMCLRK